jgi:hypothetical protein
MNKLKKYEGFFGGTHLGGDQVNTDSSHVRNVTGEPDNYSDEIIDDVETLKSDIIALLEENDFTNVQLEKIKSFIATL